VGTKALPRRCRVRRLADDVFEGARHSLKQLLESATNVSVVSAIQPSLAFIHNNYQSNTGNLRSLSAVKYRLKPVDPLLFSGSFVAM
jgi:hypothetical protein